ncbi:MAG: hypothetical protein K5837_03475 [Candidatus Saccharibacteria bacterium]|nr:hypothetical protein [Candidatus Saccharibacteria bacterium]
MEKKAQERNRFANTAIILLLIAIAILLWLLLKPQPEPTKIPTGNVDVFDIRIGCLCGDDDGDGKPDDCDKDGDGEADKVSDLTPGSEGYKSYYSSTINGRTEPMDVSTTGIVYVDDDNGKYVYQKELQIFQNAAFEYTNKIAPGVSNSYNFKVHNETNNAIRYNIDFDEDSEYAVNMLYRLKRGGTYVVGSDTEWVSSSNLSVSALKQLAKDGVDTYTLDWKWPYEGGKDAADTEAGEKMTSEYVLGIKVNFEEV